MLSNTLILSLGATLMLVPADAFSGTPRMKQLTTLDVMNPADLGNAVGSGDDSFELLGDLATLSVSNLTQAGRDIRDLLLGYGHPESDIGYTDVPPLRSKACARDTCCVWKYIADEMTTRFRGQSGRCTKWARMAIRLGFHDAGAWSRATASEGGGADGSICLTKEYTFPENSGLRDICFQMIAWYNEWNYLRGFDISMADLIRYMGANVATVVCPLGPRVRSFVGRADSAIPNKSELLPSPFAEAPELIRLFRDKTISAHSLVALLGAHTTSQQRTVNATRAGDPQDSTPGVWDVLYYEETYGSVEAPERVYMFPSDLALAKYSTTEKEWVTFLGSAGQDHWNKDYAFAYIRLSLLGVNNINKLTECTRALPARTLEYKNPDQKSMDEWLKSSRVTLNSEEIAERVEVGGTVDISNLLASNKSRVVELED